MAALQPQYLNPSKSELAPYSGTQCLLTLIPWLLHLAVGHLDARIHCRTSQVRPQTSTTSWPGPFLRRLEMPPTLEISLGPWAAAAEASSKIPTLSEIRGGPFVEFGWPDDLLSPVKRRNGHRLRGVSLEIESSSRKAHAAPAIQRVIIRYSL